MTSYDVICLSEFILLNNAIIFVRLVGETAELMLSVMIWVEETGQSNSSYKCGKRQNVLDDYGVSFVINTGSLSG